MAEKPAVITYDDFAKLNLRIATVTQAEPHPNADKLLVLQIDLGGEARQIIAGIRGHYEPASLIGRQIVVLTNLAPRAVRGLESRGMLLAATNADQSLCVLLAPQKPVPPGTRVS